jgi:hypothetical protein
VVYQRSHLAHGTTPSVRDALLVIVIHFLIVIIIAGHRCNPPRAPLSPLLAALGSLLCVLDGFAG